MGFFDSLLSMGKMERWEPTHRAIIKNLTFEDIKDELGNARRSPRGFIFWEHRLSDLDSEYPDTSHFQVSNFDYRFGKDQKPRIDDRETWFIVADSADVIRIFCREVGGMTKNIEEI